jgi:hypothetical protein
VERLALGDVEVFRSLWSWGSHEPQCPYAWIDWTEGPEGASWLAVLVECEHSDCPTYGIFCSSGEPCHTEAGG